MPYIYLFHTRASLNANENVYKIGQTKKIIQRLNQYDKLTLPLFTLYVNDHIEFEKIIKKKFNEKYIKRTDYGNEYFEGDICLMINDIISIYNENIITQKYNHLEKQIIIINDEINDVKIKNEITQIEKEKLKNEKEILNIEKNKQKILNNEIKLKQNNLKLIVKNDKIEKKTECVEKINNNTLLEEYINKYYMITNDLQKGICINNIVMEYKKTEEYKKFNKDVKRRLTKQYFFNFFLTNEKYTYLYHERKTINGIQYRNVILGMKKN